MYRMPVLELSLPPQLGLMNTHRLFSLASQVQSWHGDLVLDASALEFIDPLGLAVLGASLVPVVQQGGQVDMPWLSRHLTSYLHRMNFFADCQMPSVDEPWRQHRDQRDHLVELTRLRHEHEADEAACRLSHAMTGRLTPTEPAQLTDESFGQNEFTRINHPLQYVLTELLNNALSHARREGYGHADVWVTAQHYPSRDLVRIAVVDNGCGMLSTLRWHPKLAAPTHTAAIAAALMPRVSCNRDLFTASESVNQGVGLTTSSRIAAAAGGRMLIVSGDGYHQTAGSARHLSSPARWQGVAIGMDFRRSALPQVQIRDLLPQREGPVLSLRFE